MWTLIFYVSIGFGNGATGGPVALENFTSRATCETAGKVVMTDIPKTDWYKCVQLTK